MAQAIRKIKAGQRFLVIDKEELGFKEGTIVEALYSGKNIKKDDWMAFKWIGGNESYNDLTLGQKIEHLKRFKGKIK